MEVIVIEIVRIHLPIKKKKSFQTGSHSTCLLIDFDIWRYIGPFFLLGSLNSVFCCVEKYSKRSNLDIKGFSKD